jgi:dipeptidyl aminopeptidase/acylaminoacyl peptidase
MVVRAHPGPTSAVTMRLDCHVQFLTSRGFAVVDVDYRGSTGYGREFRQALDGRWGDADVADCAAVAQHFITAGQAAPRAVFIFGASAGGYTALQAVSRETVFAGAVARSAIVDPRRWQTTAPRWQRPHAARLAGPAGAVVAHRVVRPVLLVHGASDHVANVTDVVELAQGLAARGREHQFLLLGAGHELSAQAEHARALDAEAAFYASIIKR